MAVVQTLILLASTLIASGQRPFFAGSRPIGFPELVNKTTTPSGIEDKFGEGTTQRLPIEALGDRELVDRLSKLPIDKQPFWFINWQALEAQREKPQTYPQKPNQFLESNFQNTNSVPQTQNTRPDIANSNPGFANPNNSGVTNSNAGISSAVPGSTGNSSLGSGLQLPNRKVQDPVKTDVKDPLNTNNGDSNIVNRYGTEASTAGSTNTSIANTVVGYVNNNTKPVTVVAHPGLATSIPDSKNKEKSTNVQEENGFEDIEVRKSSKYN